MSDDLAAKAANWVPPWQRPAGDESNDESNDESDAGANAEAGAEADPGAEPAQVAGQESGLPTQWDRLAGAKWQTARPSDADDESLDDEPDYDMSDPQLSDCVSEDEPSEDGPSENEPSEEERSRDELGAVALLSGDDDIQPDDERLEDELVADDGAEVEPAGVVAAEAVWSGDVRSGAGGGLVADGGAGVAEPVAGLYEDERSQEELGAVALLSGDEGGDEGGDDFPESADWASADPVEAGQGQLFVPAQRVAEEETPPLTEAELVPALEAILMVVDEPVGEIILAQVLEMPAEQVANALMDLSARYTEEGKGFDLRRAAGGWRFYTRSEYSSYVEKFVLDGQQLRLTQASLETLAVVAYKQPVTRSRISAIRGVNCDGVVRTLITRGLIEECGTEPESGAHLYRTTNLFLEKLGLDSVAQLPPLAPFLPDDLDEVAANE